MQQRTSRRVGAASAPPTDNATTTATNQNVRIVIPPRGRASASWSAVTTRQLLIEEHSRRRDDRDGRVCYARWGREGQRAVRDSAGPAHETSEMAGPDAHRGTGAPARRMLAAHRSLALPGTLVRLLDTPGRNPSVVDLRKASPAMTSLLRTAEPSATRSA